VPWFRTVQVSVTVPLRMPVDGPESVGTTRSGALTVTGVGAAAALFDSFDSPM
jgi:hypothetical protein